MCRRAVAGFPGAPAAPFDASLMNRIFLLPIISFS
jgi:hypothetical protein